MCSLKKTDEGLLSKSLGENENTTLLNLPYPEYNEFAYKRLQTSKN